MADVRYYAECEIGRISEAEYEKALQYAERKLQSINSRYGTDHGDQYLGLLVAETVATNRFAEFTHTLHDARVKRKEANTTQQYQLPCQYYSTREPGCQGKF